MVGGALQVPSGWKTTGLSWALGQGSSCLALGLTGTLSFPNLINQVHSAACSSQTPVSGALTPLARVELVVDIVATQRHISRGGGVWRHMGPRSWAEFFPLQLVLVAHKQEALDGVPCHA